MTEIIVYFDEQFLYTNLTVSFYKIRKIMEPKWTLITVAVVFFLFSIGLGLEQYEKHECKMAALNTNKTAEEIVKICK